MTNNPDDETLAEALAEEARTRPPLTDSDYALAPPPPEPKVLSPQEVLRLGALTLREEERSEAVELLVTEQEQTYREVLKRQGPEVLIQALLDRDRALATTGRQIADGRTANRLLREYMRGVLYAAETGSRDRVERLLEALGADPADARQLKAHGSTLGALAPLEETYGTPQPEKP